MKIRIYFTPGESMLAASVVKLLQDNLPPARLYYDRDDRPGSGRRCERYTLRTIGEAAGAVDAGSSGPAEKGTRQGGR